MQLYVNTIPYSLSLTVIVLDTVSTVYVTKNQGTGTTLVIKEKNASGSAINSTCIIKNSVIYYVKEYKRLELNMDTPWNSLRIKAEYLKAA